MICGHKTYKDIVKQKQLCEMDKKDNCVHFVPSHTLSYNIMNF